MTPRLHKQKYYILSLGLRPRLTIPKWHELCSFFGIWLQRIVNKIYLFYCPFHPTNTQVTSSISSLGLRPLCDLIKYCQQLLAPNNFTYHYSFLSPLAMYILFSSICFIFSSFIWPLCSGFTQITNCYFLVFSSLGLRSVSCCIFKNR